MTSVSMVRTSFGIFSPQLAHGVHFNKIHMLDTPRNASGAGHVRISSKDI